MFPSVPFIVRLLRLAGLSAAEMALVTATAIAQLSPDEELKTLQAAPGLEVSLFASEPLITNPAAIDVDTAGRVWVAEIQWYRGGAKSPPADKIKVLEDTDGDGRADRVTVFAEGLFAPMSICVAGPRVYVATSPDLWVFEDNDGDLRADGPPQKLLTGFGGYNHDHGAHSLVLGPDHKWWMSHGDTGFDVRGTDGSRIKSQWGAVMRGELDGSQLELVASNFRNPYEVCVSSFGEAYLSDNDNDGNESARICWLLEGGDYGWFGGPPFGKQELSARLSADMPYREQWHFRGHVPGYVPATLITGFGSPTGICFYEGDAFGTKYKNAPLHTDAGPRECRVYRHEPAGFGMRATSEVFLANQGDNYFRPDDILRRTRRTAVRRRLVRRRRWRPRLQQSRSGSHLSAVARRPEADTPREARTICERCRRDRGLDEPEPCHAVPGASGCWPRGRGACRPLRNCWRRTRRTSEPGLCGCSIASAAPHGHWSSSN